MGIKRDLVIRTATRIIFQGCRQDILIQRAKTILLGSRLVLITLLETTIILRDLAPERIILPVMKTFLRVTWLAILTQRPAIIISRVSKLAVSIQVAQIIISAAVAPVTTIQPEALITLLVFGLDTVTPPAKIILLKARKQGNPPLLVLTIRS